MRLRWLASALLGSSLLVSAIPLALGADSSTTTLESNLAPQIATDLIATYDSAVKAAPGFEPFQALFTRFETVRKWEAYLEAMKAAKLKVAGGSYAAVSAAVDSLIRHGITRASIANAAIEKLAGVGDWKAADQAQAQLVIDELGTLLTEISDPVQRIRGQLVLARVELGSATPAGARIRVGTALRDLRLVTDASLQLRYADELTDVIFALHDPQTIEIVSEIVAVVSGASEREQLVGNVAKRLLGAAGDRLAAAGSADPLALAWRYQVDRLTDGAANMHQTLDALATGLDPLPIAIVLAAGHPLADRQAACRDLITRHIAAGTPMRGLNLRRLLPAEDCPADTGAVLATALAANHFDGVALALLDQMLSTAKPGDLDQPAREALAAALVESGGIDVATTHGDLLQQLLGRGEATATAARSAVVALLDSNVARGAALPRPIASALAAYAPAGLLAALITGNGTQPGLGATQPAAADLVLFREIGLHLADRPALRDRIAAFISSEAPLGYRLAFAEGYTANPTFHLTDADPVSAALVPFVATLGATPHDGLLAALGTLDPAAIADDNPQRDSLLGRLARAQAWAGESDAAAQTLARATSPDPIALAVAGIDGIGDGFERATTAIRASDDSKARVAAFRFLAEQRATRLTGTDLLAVSSAPTSAPVRVLRAAASTDPTTEVTRTATLSVSLTGPAPEATPTPPVPSLAIDGTDVARAIPYPVAGEGGVVVGGEGRFVRLARFESPSFDGQQNNGVRDFVYQQNATITPEFIFLNTGIFTLADMIAAIGRADTGAMTLLPNGAVRINRPIAVGPDATLIISGLETPELQLNATLGAYLVNAGKLYIHGTRIVGYDTDKQGPAYIPAGQSADKFRPFILSWSGSETNIADSELVALGYSAGRSYGLSLTSGPPDDFNLRAEPKPPTGTIVDNSFDNAYYGFYAYEAEGVQVLGNEYRNSIIYGIDPHDRSRHLNLSLNTAYGTYKKHGIIISREVDDSTIVGNLTFDNHGSGIMLDRASTGTVIAGNTVHNNEGDGIAVFESPCTLIGQNDVSHNGRSGILVRNSWDVGISHNQIGGNESAGVQAFISDLSKAKGSEGRNFDVDPYQPFTALSLRSNAIVGNGAGIQTAGVSSAEFFDNHFRDQSKRLFGGDLDGLSAVLLQNSGRMPTIVRTTCQPVITPPKQCRLVQLGILPSTSSSYSKGAAGNYCTSDAGNPQAQAFNGGAL